MLRVPHDPRWRAWCIDQDLAPCSRYPAERWPGILTGRGCTRWYLSQILACAPADVPIRRPSDQDRPVLGGASGIDFNRADVGACTWVAFARDRIGLDVERWPPRTDVFDLFDDDDRPATPAIALDRWLAYEAWCKATGDGIGMVVCDPPTPWQITRFDPGDGHRGALATQRRIAAVRVVTLRCPA